MYIFSQGSGNCAPSDSSSQSVVAPWKSGSSVLKWPAGARGFLRHVKCKGGTLAAQVAVR